MDGIRRNDDSHAEDAEEHVDYCPPCEIRIRFVFVDPSYHRTDKGNQPGQLQNRVWVNSHTPSEM